MSDSEIRKFIGRIQLKCQGEIAVARKYSSANGGIITQLKAEEGSLYQRQKLDNLENLIQSRMLGEGGEERKDRWKGFDTAKHFIRLDI